MGWTGRLPSRASPVVVVAAHDKVDNSTVDTSQLALCGGCSRQAAGAALRVGHSPPMLSLAKDIENLTDLVFPRCPDE